MPLDELLKAFAQRQQDQVAQVIDYLLDEGKMETDEMGRLFMAVPG